MNIPAKEIRVGDIVQTYRSKDFKVKITKIELREGKYFLYFIHPENNKESFVRKWGSTVLSVESCH